MNCPLCGKEMIACGGTPTIWQCVPCSTDAAKAQPKRRQALFQGNTHAALKEVNAL